MAPPNRCFQQRYLFLWVQPVLAPVLVLERVLVLAQVQVRNRPP
jgi:hypothetical protein